MEFETIDDPVLTMPQLISASLADRNTIENWVRYGHLVPALDLPGRKRRFSIADLLRLDITFFLRSLEMSMDIAPEIAQLSVAAYAPQALAEAREVIEGRVDSLRALFRWQFSLMRMPDGELKVIKPGDVPVELGVDLVVPVGAIANGCYARLFNMVHPSELDD